MMSRAPQHTRLPRQRQYGLTLIEVIVALAVISILALLGTRPLLCELSKSRMASQLSDLSIARDLIEAHKAEYGSFPDSLDTVYATSRVPDHLIYCVDDDDADAGHGNEFCTFFDPGNPGGNPPPQSAPVAGYILLTENDLCPCKNVDYVWLSCCGMVPDLVEYGEDVDVPGHPGHGPGGPGQGQGPG